MSVLKPQLRMQLRVLVGELLLAGLAALFLLNHAVQAYASSVAVDVRLVSALGAGLLVLVTVGGLLTARVARAADEIATALIQLSARPPEPPVAPDRMTGLPNRESFETALETQLASPREGHLLALLFVDLDQLRLINEAYGHRFGDACLREMGLRLKSVLPDSAHAFRHSADLCAVVAEMPAGQVQREVRQLAEAIRSAFLPPFSSDGRSISLTVSIGIALAPTDGETSLELTSAADAALFKAKKTGRNSVQFASREMAVRARRRLDLADELRIALPRREVLPYYQPIVNVSTRRIASAEVLARWPHPQHGFVAPEEFISIAEDSGQLDALTQQQLRTAFEDAARWESDERLVKIAVNLSARQLRPDFILGLSDALLKTGLQPCLLDVEITETALIERPETVERLLYQLKEIGVGIVLDDFGTGYSSLSYLQRLPIDKLKIDRSFVAGLGVSKQSERIIAATAALAASLDIALVAEGVETAEQSRRLRELGCTLHQGYYYARAMPASEFERWEMQRTPRLQLVNAA